MPEGPADAASASLEVPAPPGQASRWPLVHGLAITLFGFLSGFFHIHNTSIGWHLASGRWILEHWAVPRSDPFTFTAAGQPWLDHEWLFQILVALVEGVAGVPGLVVLRASLTAAIALLLYGLARRSGLVAPAAMLLSGGCVLGARLRFFLRPELLTLLLVVAAIGLYLQRRPARTWPAAIGLVTLLAANCHGAALLIPILLSVALAGDLLVAWRTPPAERPPLRPALLAVAASWLAPLCNPAGWRLYAAPLRLAHLIGQPYIPNPEWISPGPRQVPSLYLALLAAAVVLALRERHPRQWLLLVVSAALALRYVRNVGVFFVLLPLVVAPALASWARLARSAEGRIRWPVHALSLLVVMATTTALVAWPWPPFGAALSDERYPRRACDFLDSHRLPSGPLYNDVNFGGYLIERYYPARQAFIDDRNEVHERLLEEIWQILQRSDQRAWQALLDRYGVEVALLRYHPPLQVLAPNGSSRGERGFSALWFPASRWALVYWDDVAMVLIRRKALAAADPALEEFRVVRPDDLDFVARQLASGAIDRGACARELERAIRLAPAGRRATALARVLLVAPGPPPLGSSEGH